MEPYVKWRIIFTFFGFLGVTSCDFHQYQDIRITHGVEFTGNINKNKNKLSMMECALFCLDTENIALSANLCSDICNCYSQTQNVTNSVANSACTGMELKLDQEFDNCYDIFKSYSLGNGVYNISINGIEHEIFCDMDNGGWTVIQRRYDGSVNFSRSYQEYQDGFGTINGEYWLGLDKIHTMLSSMQFEVQFDLTDWNENEAFAGYTSFDVSSSADSYRLEISGYYGNAGNGMLYHNGSYFSAGGVDNDFTTSNCVQMYHGGWWYNGCHHVNINGLYNSTKYGKGLNWLQWRGHYYSLKSTMVKIKPRQ